MADLIYTDGATGPNGQAQILGAIFDPGILGGYDIKICNNLIRLGTAIRHSNFESQNFIINLTLLLGIFSYFPLIQKQFPNLLEIEIVEDAATFN